MFSRWAADVSARDSAHKQRTGPFSGRARVNRKILRFSLLIGVCGAFLTVLVYFASAYPFFIRWKDVNLRTLSEIHCMGAVCDSSTLSADWEVDDSDYVVDTLTGFLISVARPTTAGPGRFSPLDYSDTTFIAKFRQPASFNTPDGEVWRLYSLTVIVDGDKSREIIVGYALKAPWKAIETPQSSLVDVDAALKREAAKIAASLSSVPTAARPARNGFSADGFQVVNSKTKQVVEQGPWLPAFLPKGILLPAPGLKFFIYEGLLYVAQTDANERLLVTSLVHVGGIWWIVCSGAVGFLCASAIEIGRAHV